MRIAECKHYQYVIRIRAGVFFLGLTTELKVNNKVRLYENNNVSCSIKYSNFYSCLQY